MAGQHLRKVRARLYTDWLSQASDEDQFAAFRKLSEKRRAALIGYCVAQLLIVGEPTLFNQNSLSEAVIDLLKPDYAAQWRPDEGFLNRIKRNQLLEVGEACLGEHWRLEHSSSKKGALVSKLVQFFAGKLKGINDEQKVQQQHWLPEGFNRPGDDDE